MRVLYKPLFILGEIDVIRRDEDGTFLPKPLYHFVGDDGSEIYSLEYKMFDYVSDNSNKQVSDSDH